VMFDRLHTKGHAKGVLSARPRHGFCQSPGPQSVRRSGHRP
jgi:hypothetical protein